MGNVHVSLHRNQTCPSEKGTQEYIQTSVKQTQSQNQWVQISLVELMYSHIGLKTYGYVWSSPIFVESLHMLLTPCPFFHQHLSSYCSEQMLIMCWDRFITVHGTQSRKDICHCQQQLYYASYFANNCMWASTLSWMNCQVGFPLSANCHKPSLYLPARTCPLFPSQVKPRPLPLPKPIRYEYWCCLPGPIENV